LNAVGHLQNILGHHGQICFSDGCLSAQGIFGVDVFYQAGVFRYIYLANMLSGLRVDLEVKPTAAIRLLG
jgi:hypothetical protein